MAKREYKVGQVLTFKRGFSRYGKTATIQGIGYVVTRPYGAIITLIDLFTETGVRVQWPQSQVTDSFKCPE
jgi:hypothetical protein